MAGVPFPGAAPGPMAPGAPSMPPPGGMQAPPQGAGPIPGMGGPPPTSPPPRPQGPGGLGPASPLGDAFTDLSGDLPLGWQMLDICSRLLKKAINTPEIRRLRKVSTTLVDMNSTLTRMISHYTTNSAGASPDSGGPAREAGADEEPDTTSADADAAPDDE